MTTFWGEKKQKSKMNIQKLLKVYCGKQHDAHKYNFRLEAKKDTTEIISKKLSNPSKPKPLETNSMSATKFSFCGTPGGKKHSTICKRPVSVEDEYTRINDLQLKIQRHKDEIEALTKRKENYNKAKQLNKYLNDIEEGYVQYAKLAEKTIKQRENEKDKFREYAEACQHKQKVKVNAKQELSHLKMKIKLLQETLHKRTMDYNSLINKKDQTVFHFIKNRQRLLTIV